MTFLPNFLIVWAWKSWTTSLYKYLQQHKDIFFPDHKEPKFITSQFLDLPFEWVWDDILENTIITNFDDYKKLYNFVNNEKIVWDASPDNLYYYNNSIPIIKKYLWENVKILIILRNPTDRAYSSYLHLVRDWRESLSFEDSLKEEEQRIKNNREPLWHLKKVWLYYEQVKSFIESFENVKVCYFEDLKNNSEQLLIDIFSFLWVDSTVQVDISKKYNISWKPKSKILHSYMKRKSIIKDIVKWFLKIFMNEEQIIKLRWNIIEKNLSKISMNESTKIALNNYFRGDIIKLEKLLNKDLSYRYDS